MLAFINNAVLYKFKDTKIFYKKFGNEKGVINIFLHGWGQSANSFDEIMNQFENFNNFLLDLPPFGKSGKIKDWDIFTYADMVISFCERKKIKKCNLIGHSFGGRIAVLISSLKPNLVNKLVLVDSAGMKPHRKINYYFKIYSYKIMKFFGLGHLICGSSDYCLLEENMKKTFVSIVNTYLENYCSNIIAPTLIIFGEDDQETPIYMAIRFNKLIKNSKLVLLPHAGHFSFVDRPIAFCCEVKSFLEENN